MTTKNREELKLEVGKKYRTRNGCEVEILKVGLVGTAHPVCAVYTHSTGYQSVVSYTNLGYLYDFENQTEKDIISEIKPKKVLWVNVYHAVNSQGFSTKEAADHAEQAPDRPRRACIRVEYEEGQFDNEETN